MVGVEGMSFRSWGWVVVKGTDPLRTSPEEGGNIDLHVSYTQKIKADDIFLWTACMIHFQVFPGSMGGNAGGYGVLPLVAEPKSNLVIYQKNRI